MRCTAGIGAYLFGFVVAAAPPTTPAPQVPAAEANPIVVLYVPDLDGVEDDEILLKSIEAQVDRDAVQLRVLRYEPWIAEDPSAFRDWSRRAAKEFAAGGVMWIRLSTAPGKPHAVFLYEPEGDRFLGRRVPVQRDSSAAALEIVSNIAGSVVAESVTGPVAALEEVDPETLEEAKPEPKKEPEQKPEPKNEPKSAEPVVFKRKPVADPKPFARIWVMAAYAGNTLSDAVIWQNAIALGAAWSPVPGAFIGLRYDIVFATRLRFSDLQVAIRRHPVTLEGGYRLALDERFDIEFYGRATVDPTTRVSTGGGTPAQLRLFSGAGGGVGFGYRPIRQLRIAARVGAEALLTRAAYVYDEDGTRKTALDPHPARLLVELGVHYGLLWRARKPRKSL